MPLLRPSSIQQLVDELAASKFGAVGFDASFPDSGDLAVVVFTAKKGIKLAISSSGAVSNPLQVRVSPGEYKNEDVIRCENFRECLKLIQPWARRIHEDLRIQDPQLDEMQKFREALDRHIRSNLKEETDTFSADEIQELTSKLDALTARLEEMEGRHEITEAELRKLQQVLQDAKADLPDLPKGVWYRTAGGKVWETMKNVASSAEVTCPDSSDHELLERSGFVVLA